MTGLELYTEIQRQINNLDNLLYIPSSEITMALNKAINVYIETFYKIFESDELSRKRLNKLVKTAKIYNEVNNPPLIDLSIDLEFNGYFLYKINFNITNLKFVVLELGKIIKNPNSEIFLTSKIVPINLDAVTSNTNNPFKKPYKNKLWRIELNGTHYILIPNKYTLKEYHISYIQLPEIDNITRNDLDLNQYFDDIFIHNELIPLIVRFSIEPYTLNKTSNESEVKKESINENTENNK